MFRRLLGTALARLSLAAIALLLVDSAAFAQVGASFGAPSCGAGGCGTASIGAPCGTAGCAPASCGFHCPMFHCPPPLKWCREGPPRICWKCGCPKPICNPCNAPNWGYFQKCWTPWPWGQDWSHCPVQPPAALVFPTMMPITQMPVMMSPMAPMSPDETLPTPRQLETRPPL